MSGTKGGVQAACQQLTDIRADIEVRLESNPSWSDLRELDKGPRRKSAARTKRRAGLVAKLDKEVPDWRLVAAIGAALATLEEALLLSADASTEPDPVKIAPSLEAHPLRPADPMSLLERIRAAADAGPAAPATLPDVEPTDPVDPIGTTVEEAEVEILVPADHGKVPAVARATAQTHGLMQTNRIETGQNQPVISFEAEFDEATVEIIVFDDGIASNQGPPKGGPTTP